MAQECERIGAQFEESLTELQKVRLHEAIVGGAKKKECLGDVYYERAKMLKWKESCVRQFRGQEAKIDKIVRQVELLEE